MSSIHADRIVIFDGHCNLCQRVIQELLIRDLRKVFFFTALTSEYSRKKSWDRVVNTASPQGPESVLYFRSGILHRESSAAIWIAWDLGGFYRALAILMALFPRFFRDWIYRFVAGRRYGWFGKTESCWLPKAEWMSRFLP